VRIRRTRDEVIRLAQRDEGGALAGSCNTCAHAVLSRCERAELTEQWRERHLYILPISGVGVLHVVPDERGIYPCASYTQGHRFVRARGGAA
jgi:hypothetical protein